MNTEKRIKKIILSWLLMGLVIWLLILIPIASWQYYLTLGEVGFLIILWNLS